MVRLPGRTWRQAARLRNDAASLLMGSFVVESIFAVPGLGNYFVESINTQDYSLIMGLTIFYGLFLVTVNFAIDILYGVVDPRIRLGGKANG